MTKDELVAQIRKRLTPDKAVCPACYECRIHTDAEYRLHPGEGRHGLREESKIHKQSG